MLATTLKIVRSGFESDPTLTPADRTRLMATLRNGLSPQIKPAFPPLETTPRLIRRAEAARRYSCSIRTIDKLAASGFLKKRKLPGRVRASGFLASDVDALIQGEGIA